MQGYTVTCLSSLSYFSPHAILASENQQSPIYSAPSSKSLFSIVSVVSHAKPYSTEQI